MNRSENWKFSSWRKLENNISQKGNEEIVVLCNLVGEWNLYHDSCRKKEMTFFDHGHKVLFAMYNSGGSRIFKGLPTPERRALAYYLANNFLKLHKNERYSTQFSNWF